MGQTIVIKDVDEEAYRRLKSKAAREGLKLGDPASLAFRVWAQQGAERRVRDLAKIKRAAEIMDKNRSKLRILKDWSSVEVIRKWRQSRQIS